MDRFLYEKSISYQGYLIIPFVRVTVSDKKIYSYMLLSQWGHKGKFHKSENPADLYCSQLEKIIEIAQDHLDHYSDIVPKEDYFHCRYTYQNDLIVIYQEAEKYFYDHYKPYSLNNIAAPKLFLSQQDCINWVKAGLDRSGTVTEP
ncbi:hypothetical protein PCC9214_02236 [Planktothrix tepida]|uniref:Uncharacterized protein n=2 Tax=Planktothrix TaxID=54304 RepID=A0A1J1LLJ1_9CYAN|nr:MULTISPECIES: hypothetical protein [Planktothrix]CAD5945872.1 hypothetical protein PCC9214_02236 [Planktothrix tepida]CAD5965175.1 hypothetical protein NO713_03453 [Planktothrix pseudagardhii]CUR32804.1 conserved hypothetical protein [Planktothrix tepida PCC 9214]